MADVEQKHSVFITLNLSNAAALTSMRFKVQVNIDFEPDAILLSNLITDLTTTNDIITYLTTTLPISSSGVFVGTPTNDLSAFTNSSKILTQIPLGFDSIVTDHSPFQVMGRNVTIRDMYDFTISSVNGAVLNAVGQISFRLDFIKYRLQARPSQPTLEKPAYIK